MNRDGASSTANVVDFAARRRRGSCREVGRTLRCLLEGDRAAAAWIYDTFADRLYRRLRRRYGYPGGLDPDDLLHDAFIFYFQNDGKVLRDFLERVPPEKQTRERLERHLWDLACGVASNRRRSASLRDHWSLDENPVEPADDRAPSLEERAVGRDQLARLDRCLEGQNGRVYLYYRLRFWDGHTPNEIAEIMGWSTKATYKLRQALNEAVRFCAESLGIEEPG